MPASRLDVTYVRVSAAVHATHASVIMSPPLIGRGIKRCLIIDVCRVHRV